jgi:hypothetical protein
MRRFILAGVSLALAAGAAASAPASEHMTGQHVGRFHAATSGGTHHVGRSGRVAGVRREIGRPDGESPGYHGGFIDLGPLGVTAACGSYRRGYGYCGPSYGAPVDAWSY